MPPKPKAKPKGASEEDEAARRHKMKRIKEVLEQFLTEANLPFDQILLNKIYDSQGWPRPGGPEDPVASQKLVIVGEETMGRMTPEQSLDIDSEEAKTAAAQAAGTATGVKAAGKALKLVCPLHCVLNSICYWRMAVCDEGLKGLADFAVKVKPGVWEGLVNLELQECQITAEGCDLLSEKLQENIPLRSLVLDFNKIGDKGAGYLATGLQTNTNLWTLRLAYCGLTAKSGEDLATGMIRGSKIRNLDVRGNQLGTYATSSGQIVKGSAVVPMMSGMTNHVLWRGANEEELQNEIKNIHQARPAEPTQAPAKGAVEAVPSLLRAGAGAWAGWEIFTATEGEDKVLYALTETLKKLDLCDNCIVEDLQVHGLTLTCAAHPEDAFFTINESAVQIGAAHIHEGSYCQVGDEIVRVTSLRPAVTCLLSDDMDPVTNVLPISEHDQAMLNARAGSLLRMGKETLTVRAARQQVLLVNRAQGQGDAIKHPARTRITRATELDVVRGRCFTEPALHDEGARLLRVSAIQHMVDCLRASSSLTDLLLEHNSVGQEGAELLLDPTRRLTVFTVTGKGVQESLFKELYKDGSAKKGKKGKGKKKK